MLEKARVEQVAIGHTGQSTAACNAQSCRIRALARVGGERENIGLEKILRLPRQSDPALGDEPCCAIGVRRGVETRDVLLDPRTAARVSGHEFVQSLRRLWNREAISALESMSIGRQGHCLSTGKVVESQAPCHRVK